MLESRKKSSKYYINEDDHIWKKIIKLHSKGFEGSWELWIQNMIVFNVFNKTLSCKWNIVILEMSLKKFHSSLVFTSTCTKRKIQICDWCLWNFVIIFTLVA
jgi:hypothetical protein